MTTALAFALPWRPWRKGKEGEGQDRGRVPRKGMWSLKELLQLGSLLGKDPRAWRPLFLTALEQGGLGLGQTQPDVVTLGVPQNHPSSVSGGSLRASLEKCELRKVLGKKKTLLFSVLERAGLERRK